MIYDNILRVSWEAGQNLLKFYRNSALEISLKRDASPLTSADLASDKVLQEKLTSILPGSFYISEETYHVASSKKEYLRDLTRYEACWLVDPLDGTRDFIAGTGEFTVNIALLRRGSIEAGILYAPVRNLTYLAIRNQGCFKVSKSGIRIPIHGRKWNPLNIKAFISRSHSFGEKNVLRGVFSDCDIQGCGSALKYGYLAEGLGDFSLRRSPTAIWDTAAAQCILEEAGGEIWIKDGSILRFSEVTELNQPFLAVSDRTIKDEWRRKILELLP